MSAATAPLAPAAPPTAGRAHHPPLLALPDGVLAQVLESLTIPDVCAFACSCRDARVAADDDAGWAARAATLARGTRVGTLAEWGLPSYRALVLGLLYQWGWLLDTPLASTSHPLGTLATTRLVPGAGLVGSALTPMALHLGFLRTPLFAVKPGPPGAAHVCCTRRGRPPPGRGALPDSHAAAFAVGGAERVCGGGGGEGGSGERPDGGGVGDGDGDGIGAPSPQPPPPPKQGKTVAPCASSPHPAWGHPTPLTLTCTGGCRQDVVEAQARLEACLSAPSPAAEVRPGGPAGPPPLQPPLPDVGNHQARFHDLLLTLGALHMGDGGASEAEGALRCVRLAPVPTPLTSASGLAGLWKGTYGPHGVEVLHLRPSPSISVLGGVPGVEAVKVTGDFHVPAGEVSFALATGGPPPDPPPALAAAYASLPAPLALTLGVAADVELGPPAAPLAVTALHSAAARVAGARFTNPRYEPALGQLCGEAALAVTWYALGKVAVYVRVHPSELR